MKQRSFFTILITGVLALLTLSAGGFYWLTTQTPLNLLRGGPTTTPAAAMFVPKQAPAMLSLLVSPDRLQALGQVFAPPQERGRAQAEFNQITESLLADTGINYGRDIQPWLGDELTLAVTDLDFDRDSSNGEQAGLLLALATTKPDRTQEFLDLFWQKQAAAGQNLAVESYEGVKLIYRRQGRELGGNTARTRSLKAFPSDPSPALATAIVTGDRHSFVLFANDPKVLKDAINNVQAPNLNLNSAPNYQKALQPLTQPRIALAFADLPQLTDWLSTQQLQSQAENPSLSSASLAISVGLNPEGLLAQTAFLTPDGEELSPPPPGPVKALQYIPAISPFVAASHDLKGLWNQLSAGLLGDELFSPLVSQALTGVQTIWGLDLPQDIFSWVEGEYALALFPRGDRHRGDWIFVAEQSADSQKAVAHLDAIALSQEYSIGNFLLAGEKISAWTRLTTTEVSDSKNTQNTIIKAEAKGVHATVGNYEIFTTSVEAMDEALKAIQTGTLVANADFQTSLAPLPQPNYGYLYLDWAASREIWERQIPLLKLIELSVKPFFDHLRSLTITSIGTDADVHRAAVLIRLS